MIQETSNAYETQRSCLGGAGRLDRGPGQLARADAAAARRAEIPAESQKTAHALSEAFVAVAEFVKPSVVQISVEQQGRAVSILGRGNRRMPFPGPGGPQGIDPKDFEEMLKRFFGPDGPSREGAVRPRRPRGPARASSMTTRATS